MKITTFVTCCEGFGIEGKDNVFIWTELFAVPDVSGLQYFYHNLK